ncbi:MAG: hypothetical protein ABR567_09200 [Myxococcales bacterium]
MGATGKVEERSVTKSEIEGGISLRAGHEVVLIITDGIGTPRRQPLPDDSDEPDQPDPPSEQPDQPD